MSCTTCQRVKNIYTCATSIVIGTVPDPNEDYLVYFKASSTGKVIAIPETSSAQSLLTIEDLPEFLAGTDYEVWVTLNPPDAVNERVGVLVEDVEYDCFVVRFDRIYDIDNLTVTELEQMFVLA